MWRMTYNTTAYANGLALRFAMIAMKVHAGNERGAAFRLQLQVHCLGAWQNSSCWLHKPSSILSLSREEVR